MAFTLSTRRKFAASASELETDRDGDEGRKIEID